MQIYNVRFVFEHRHMLTLIRKFKKKFLYRLYHGKTSIYRLMSGVCEKRKLDNPYDESQCSVRFGVFCGVYVVKFNFPEPESERQCYCAYLLHDKNFSHYSYICIEKESDLGAGKARLVCVMEPSGRNWDRIINYTHRDKFGPELLYCCRFDDMHGGVVRECNRVPEDMMLPDRKEHIQGIAKWLQKNHPYKTNDEAMIEAERLIESIERQEVSLSGKVKLHHNTVF